MAAFAVVAVFGTAGAIGVTAYRNQPAPQAAVEVPLIAADRSPTKVRPEDPGGLQVPDQDKVIYEAFEGGAEAPVVERLLPPPEEPMVWPEPPAVEAEPTPETGDSPADLQPPPDVPETDLAEEAPQLNEGTAAEQEAEDLTTAEVAIDLSAEDAAMLPSASAVSDAPAPVAAPAAVSDPRVAVQIASLRTPEAATAEWERLLRLHPDLLTGLSPRTERVDLGPERGIFYRLRAIGLAGRAAAEALCEKARSRDLGCMVVDL